MSKHGLVIIKDDDCYPGDSHTSVTERWEHGKLLMRLQEDEYDYGGIPDYKTTLEVFDPNGKLVYTLNDYRNGADSGSNYTETIDREVRKGSGQDGWIEWKFERSYEEAIKPITF